MSRLRRQPRVTAAAACHGGVTAVPAPGQILGRWAVLPVTVALGGAAAAAAALSCRASSAAEFARRHRARRDRSRCRDTTPCSGTDAAGHGRGSKGPAGLTRRPIDAGRLALQGNCAGGPALPEPNSGGQAGRPGATGGSGLEAGARGPRRRVKDAGPA